jgi:hypothetical protein
MRWSLFFSFLFFLLAVGLLMFYWFIPSDINQFAVRQPENTNFSLSSLDSDSGLDVSEEGNGAQFYTNMRYPSSRISYKISDCSLQKTEDMERAFDLVESETVLDFYSVSSGEEISVTCDSSTRVEGNLFIAGEGGPTNITQTNLFNVILSGKIVLIRESSCKNPNIGIHELLHALGFDHSPNPDNIMYSVSNCKQDIGQDTIGLIDSLYLTSTYADLNFEEVSANKSGRYLNTEISIRNEGLKISEEAEVFIYADGKLVKTVDLAPIDIGYGRRVSLGNVAISRNTEVLEYAINSNFEEIDRNNNKVVLELV